MVLTRGSRRSFMVRSALAFSSIGLVRAPAKAAQFEFKCASDLPVDHPSSVRLRPMWAAIERESGGRIHTQFFPNGQLGAASSLFAQVRLGALQFLLLSPGNVATVVPATDIAYVGFAYKDQDEAGRVLDALISGYLRAEAEAKGLHLFRTSWIAGMLHIGSTPRPIRAPDDLRGFKIRVQESKLTVDLFKLLGASPTPLSLVETYTSLQTKLIDGEALSLVTISSLRLFEVNKYISLTNHAWGGEVFVANGDVWKRLPADLQDIIERNHTKYATLQGRDTKLLNASLRDKLTRQGLVINDVDQTPFVARLRPYYDACAATFGPTAWGLLESSLGRRLA
jgi:TRAP-type transport system periplasmic protein